MKYLLTLFTLVCSMSLCFGQNQVEVVYSNDFSVSLNRTSIDKSTTYEEITELLGKPEIFKEYRTGKVNYRYPELGLVFHTVNGKLLTLAFNFNWDGDKNFPNTMFKGKLNIGDKTIDGKTTASIISELKEFEIDCIIPGMCMNNPKKIKNPILLGFKDDLITQVSIEFH